MFKTNFKIIYVQVFFVIIFIVMSKGFFVCVFAKIHSIIKNRVNRFIIIFSKDIKSNSIKSIVYILIKFKKARTLNNEYIFLILFKKKKNNEKILNELVAGSGSLYM